MFFRVENLGPLREAEVDLSKSIILLTGPNSTGKTYLAWSVYGLFRSFDAPRALAELATEILAAPRQTVETDRLIERWPSILTEAGDVFAGRVHLCFASERRYFANSKILIRTGLGEPAVRSAVGRALYRGAASKLDILVTMAPRLRVSLHTRPRLGGPSNAFETFSESERRAVLEDLVGILRREVRRRVLSLCTLLPAERTAVDLFAKELSLHRTELVDRAVEAELDPAAVPVSISRTVGRYPWPIQDSLRAASDLAYMARISDGTFADLAEELEAFLGGSLSLSSEGLVEFKPAGSALPIGIHLTSALVKSLTSLVFFFRHQARNGHLLMIDEPELNLHPDNQRKLARVLAKAANRGLRLIMSTHSDYILRELNNLVLLSRDTEPVRALRARHGYAESELLAPSSLGVYLFKGGTCRSVDVTEDGFEVETIEAEINRMNAISQEIYAALHE